MTLPEPTTSQSGTVLRFNRWLEEADSLSLAMPLLLCCCCAAAVAANNNLKGSGSIVAMKFHYGKIGYRAASVCG
jgi:hypothetical protein